jgi:hypothetical protein
MPTFYAHIEVRFKANSSAEAQAHAETIVRRLERGFVLPVIDVEGAEVFTVDRIKR